MINNTKQTINGKNFQYDPKKNEMLMWLSKEEFIAITNYTNTVKILTFSEKFGNTYYYMLNSHVTIIHDPVINK